MKRCKHPNVRIEEEYLTASTYHFGEGRLIQGIHHSQDGSYTGMIDVSCDDCGMQKRYGLRRPEWLEDYLIEAWQE